LSVKNLFLEESVKTQIKKCRFDFVKSLLDVKQQDQTELSFGKLEMPRLKDLKESIFPPTTEKIAVAGLVRLNPDDVIRSSNEMNWLQILQMTTKIFKSSSISLMKKRKNTRTNFPSFMPERVPLTTTPCFSIQVSMTLKSYLLMKKELKDMMNCVRRRITEFSKF